MAIVGRTFFVALLIFTACKPQKETEETNISRPLENPKRFQDGGVLMLLPGKFIRTTFDSALYNTFESPAFIFHDSTNTKNTFSFTEASYLDVEEGMEEEMFTEFESVMKESCKESGVSCKLVENDMFSLSNGYKVFKMSYLVDKEYSTTYFVASDTRILKVVVNTVADDGEASVRTMNIDRYFYEDHLPAN